MERPVIPRKAVIKKRKELWHEILMALITGVVFAVIATLLSTWIMNRAEKKRRIDEQLDNLSKVYIGCNKQWADEKFGVPQFSGTYEDYTLCAYVSDYYVLQMAFDEGMAARSYLITALHNSENVHITIRDMTLNNHINITLGETSYYDFPGSPQSVRGFVSNGNARAGYYEHYYLCGFGNYYNYYIASLDYGELNGSLQEFLREFGMPSGDIDDEVLAEKNGGVQIITDRRKSCPNSYGVSESNTTIMDMLLTESMMSEDVRKRELAPLQSIRDNYEKIVLSLEPGLDASYDGIKSENLIDWLLRE